MCALPATRWLLRRFFIVPSTATTGSDETNSGIMALAQAVRRSSAMCSVLMRSLRDRPEPFSSVSSGAEIFFEASQSLMTRAACSVLAGGRSFCAPMVRT